MTALAAAKWVLLIAAIAFVLVGSICFVKRTTRFVRRHRGKVSTLRGWLTAALEDWVDEPESSIDRSDYETEDEEVDASVTTDGGGSGDGSSH